MLLIGRQQYEIKKNVTIKCDIKFINCPIFCEMFRKLHHWDLKADDIESVCRQTQNEYGDVSPLSHNKFGHVV